MPAPVYRTTDLAFRMAWASCKHLALSTSESSSTWKKNKYVPKQWLLEYSMRNKPLVLCAWRAFWAYSASQCFSPYREIGQSAICPPGFFRIHPSSEFLWSGPKVNLEGVKINSKKSVENEHLIGMKVACITCETKHSSSLKTLWLHFKWRMKYLGRYEMKNENKA